MNQQYFDVHYQIVEQSDASAKTLSRIKKGTPDNPWRLLEPMTEYFFNITFEPCPINRLEIRLCNVDKLTLALTNSKRPTQKPKLQVRELSRSGQAPDTMNLVKIASYLNQDNQDCDRLEVKMESRKPELMGIQQLAIKCSYVVKTTERLMKIENISQSFSNGLPPVKKQAKKPKQQKSKVAPIEISSENQTKQLPLITYTQDMRQILIDLDGQWLKKQHQSDVEHNVPPQYWLSILAQQVRPKEPLDIRTSYQQKLKMLGIDELPSFMK